MFKPTDKDSHANHISLLLVEGATEIVFYTKVRDAFLNNCRTRICDLKGLYNINKKIINRIVECSGNHEEERIRVYCCLDRESRYGEVPEFDIERIRKYIEDERIENVLSIELIKATQQIESWFFYDIENIFSFLKVPRANRNPSIYRPPEKFSCKDLQRLFERYGRSYNKGKDSENFINNLDIEKIARECKELRDGIELIRTQDR